MGGHLPPYRSSLVGEAQPRMLAELFPRHRHRISVQRDRSRRSWASSGHPDTRRDGRAHDGILIDRATANP